MTTQQYQIKRVTAQAGLDNFNTPISQIQAALNTLEGKLQGISNKQALIQYQQPLYRQNDVITAQIGDLMYWDAQAAAFRPALSLLRAYPGQQGQSLQAPCSRVCGMLLSIHNGTGTLLTGGFYTSQAAVLGCLGPNALPGTYYLSSTDQGKAVKDTKGMLRQPVLQYFGNGKFCIPLYYMAQDTHQHATIILQGHWVPLFGDSGLSYKYMPTSQQVSLFAQLGQLTTGTTAIFYKGVLQTPNMDLFKIIDSQLYLTKGQPPVAGDVLLANHYPLAYGSPIVRSVQSVSPRLAVTSKGHGQIQLDLQDFQYASQQLVEGTAIHSIKDNVIVRTPVITDLQAGSGITITKSATGAALISSSYLAQTPLQATLVNFNGAVQVAQQNFIYTTFVKGSDTSIVYYMPVHDVREQSVMAAYPWVQAASQGTLTVRMDFVPIAKQAPVQLPVSLPTVGGLTIPQVDKGCVYFVQGKQGITIKGPGMLVCCLQHSSSDSALSLLRYGFILHHAVAYPDVNKPTTSSVDAMIYSSVVAGEDIPAFTTVYIKQGKAYICRAAQDATYDLAVGMTAEDYAQGSDVSIISAGTIQNSSLALTPGAPIYIGAAGQVLQNMDQAAQSTLSYVQRVGIALNSTTIQVRIGTAISLMDASM